MPPLISREVLAYKILRDELWPVGHNSPARFELRYKIWGENWITVFSVNAKGENIFPGKRSKNFGDSAKIGGIFKNYRKFAGKKTWNYIGNLLEKNLQIS